MTLLKLTLASLLLGGCFARPSDSYACQTSAECDPGRTCEENFCVIGAGSDDAGTDGTSANDCENFASRHFDACMLPTPGATLSLAGGEWKYNTTTGELTDTVNANVTTPPHKMVGDFQVISVDGFSIAAGATLRVTGTAPLVIASWGTIDVLGTIDVSSSSLPALTLGAGANPTSCATRLATAGNANAGSGDGGGGGGNATAGANGGKGGGDNGTNNWGNGAGLGGAAAAATQLLAGGCPGSVGRNQGSTPGAGGAGGGAIQLTAKTSINIAATGRINAGGSGGRGAASNGNGDGGGGGGGGAGGMIGLEAKDLFVTGGILAANGGGGGQGGGQSAGGAGADAALAATPAAGGAGGSGGEGGLGLVTATAPSNAAGTANGGHEDFAGGGGGGGAAGIITLKGTRNDGTPTYSPAPTVVP